MLRSNSALVLSAFFGVSLIVGCIVGTTLSPATVGAVGSWMFLDWLHPSILPEWLFLWLRNMVATTGIIVLAQLPRYLEAFRRTPPALLVIAVLLSNGIVPGVLVGTLAATTGIRTTRLVLFGLLPHGVFEIPVLLWACLVALRPLDSANPDGSLPPLADLSQRLHLFVPMASVLLLCAALVEDGLTPLLLSRFVLRN